MSNYDNTNSGALFKNDEKTPEKPNWPDYNGSINVEGKEFWLKAWIKKSKGGKTYMSLSVEGKQEKQNRQQRASAPEPASNFDNFDDDIPF